MDSLFLQAWEESGKVDFSVELISLSVKALVRSLQVKYLSFFALCMFIANVLIWGKRV